jgi:hypothetical protein
MPCWWRCRLPPLTVCADCLEPLRDGELTVTGGTHPVEATM